MKKLAAILTIFVTTTMQSYVPQSALERNINWFMVGGFAAIHALYFARLNYGVSAQLLEESDSFKQMVQEEFESMGITDHTSYFVKISGDQTIERSVMVALPGGIIVADSLYQAYKQPESDKDAVRFMVRHEAAHFRNGDYYKRIAFKVAVYAALVYGFDYFINTVEQSGYLPDFLSSFKAQLLLKIFVNGPLDGLLTNYFCAYNQEHNADQQAATTFAIAAVGSRAMGCIAEVFKKTSLLHHWLESTPLLCRLIAGYPTYIDRSKTLAEVAERLDIKTDNTLLQEPDLSIAVAHELFDADYYQPVFESIEQEIGIKFIGLEKYQDEIELYKKALIDRVASYIRAICSQEELSQMIAGDDKADGWRKIPSAEYSAIIEECTKQFVVALLKK